ncbi:cryptochrome/photolyase family protein [Aureitalea marina]|uniref:Cryptochrome/photolyase family protein n=1 Tax=Aureitalea marina TaxID=930804 RepID=A0A2S7KQU9_9FLAO|nr:cryptochrome/photolyase family protein [Aureitalea marina]PQB04991.1 cryptochrome/photolyase family protein [Aureitalea marina]
MTKTLRLILGDQLNSCHSWFQQVNPDVTYVMIESHQEQEYVTHHIQKIVGFVLAMRSFGQTLTNRGHQLIYMRLDDPQNRSSLTDTINSLIEAGGFERFEYLLPDEYRLDLQLINFCQSLKIATGFRDTEHFYTQRDEMALFFEGKSQYLMESFYRYMRKKHGVLMLNDTKPIAGQWNFDKDNRNKWKGQPAIPELPDLRKPVAQLITMINEQGIKTIGAIDPEDFNWPTNRAEGLELLEYFCNYLLPHFGTYQDAMHTDQPFLFHSRLSFALNLKILSPKEVVDRVIDHWADRKEDIDLAQVEGFVRQIIGWREYIRGMYWLQMPDYERKNFFKNDNPLPQFYWSGETKMNCMKHAISQSLDLGYAHHIQRLMVTGNFALLSGVSPEKIDAWYLGIYTDAIQWVQLPNTRGMSQFADGGLLATKPYVSSGSYINKMSNYCQGCAYNVKTKVEKDSCPFNSMYWNFLYQHRDKLANNRRMSMMYRQLDKMDGQVLTQMVLRAQDIIENPDAY